MVTSSLQEARPQPPWARAFPPSVALSIWWVYFDDVAFAVKMNRANRIIWLYGHMPLALGLTTVASGQSCRGL